MRNGFCTTSPSILPAAERLDQLLAGVEADELDLARCVLAASSASSMPKVVDSFGQKMPCTLL